MSGIPTETREDLDATVSLVFELMRLNPNVHISPFYIFTPYPGTELFNVALEHGMKPPSSLEEWASFRHEEINLFPDHKHFYESLYFTSLFLDRKAKDYTAPGWIRLLADLYRPVARFRTRRFFFKGLFEKQLMEVLLGLWQGAGQNMRRKKPLTAQ
jgi:radical SAM superfamily enzyme YgiQ (UPF0313 family)